MFATFKSGLPHQEAYDVPSYSTLRNEGKGQPVRFRLTSDDFTHEVQIVQFGGRCSLPGGDYSAPGVAYAFEAIVCPVETVDTTMKGVRSVQVKVDHRGKATWL